MIEFFKKWFNSVKTNQNKINYKILIIGLFVLLVEIITLVQPFGKIKTVQNVGEVIENDIIANTEIKYIDKKSTENNVAKITAENIPIFRFDKSISDNAKNTILNLFTQLPLENVDLQEICNIFDKNLITVYPKELSIIKNIIKNYPDFPQDFGALYSSYAHKGIMNKDVIITLNNPKKIKIISTSGSVVIETEYKEDDFENFFIKNETLRQDINVHLQELTDNERYLVLSFMNKALLPNIIYDKEATQNALQSKIKSYGTIYKTIKKGQFIARKGDILTEEHIETINELNNAVADPFSVKRILHNLYLIVIFTIFSIYFILQCKDNLFAKIEDLLFLIISMLIFITAITLPSHFDFEMTSIYYGLFIPITALSLTFAFLYSKMVSLFVTIIMSLVFFILSSYNVTSFLFVFFSGVSSLFKLSQITRRSQLLRHGIFISFLNIVIASFVIVAIGFLNVNIIHFYTGAFLNGIISSILAIGCISIGELLLNTPTVFRLQELSDLSTPLMRDLNIHANGTFNHTLSVATLAEDAANNIGANGILAKIGAYYHDVGKIDNPEYFTENQNGYNIHDELKPAMSAIIIRNHVKKSIEKAEAAKLPPKVIEIIAQHHGDGIIKYFYDKALNNVDTKKEEIKEDTFRYPGPKPQFIESAIVMLADQAEAATRSLINPTPASIEKKINGIIDDNYESGMLDDSGLTLKEISKIKACFTKMISGMKHTRVAYQEKAEKVTDHPNAIEHNEKVSK